MQMTQNNMHNNWLEILAGKNFPPKIVWRKPVKIHLERTRRRQQEAAKQSISQGKFKSFKEVRGK